MAHEICEYDNMLSVHETPWHGLGVVLDDYPTIAEAQRISGLDWTVRKEPIYYKQPTEDGEVVALVPDAYAVVRNDNQCPLGVVGSKYEPFQNDAMFEFIGRYMDLANANIETCGSIRNGRVVWGLVTAGETEYVRNDPIAKYLLFKNGFAADQAIEICWTDVRVVCNNTLQAALRGAKGGYRVKHTQNVHTQVAAIRDALHVEHEYREKLYLAMRDMAIAQLTSQQVEKAVKEIVVGSPVDVDPEWDGEEVKEKITNRQKQTIAKILDLHETGAGSDIIGVRGTAYGVLQACTEWSDHFRNYRVGKRNLSEVRFESAMMGVGQAFKAKAFDYCYNLAMAA